MIDHSYEIEKMIREIHEAVVTGPQMNKLFDKFIEAQDCEHKFMRQTGGNYGDCPFCGGGH